METEQFEKGGRGPECDGVAIHLPEVNVMLGGCGPLRRLHILGDIFDGTLANLVVQAKHFAAPIIFVLHVHEGNALFFGDSAFRMCASTVVLVGGVAWIDPGGGRLNSKMRGFLVSHLGIVKLRVVWVHSRALGSHQRPLSANVSGLGIKLLVPGGTGAVTKRHWSSENLTRSVADVRAPVGKTALESLRISNVSQVITANQKNSKNKFVQKHVEVF